MRRTKALLQGFGLQTDSKKSIVKIAVFALLLFVAFFVGKTTAPARFVYQDTRSLAPIPYGHQKINKEFKFSVKNAAGTEITRIRYNIQSADLQNDIILKGQRATAVKGKTFLIINLKITNDSDKTLQINSRDYIRLSVNNSKEFLASDIHNDPILIQAISTKYSRIGFPINDTDKRLMLLVGEIDGNKTDITLSSLKK